MPKSSSRKTAPANVRAKHRHKRAQHRPPKGRRQTIDPSVPTDFRAAFEGPPAQYDIETLEAQVAQLAPWSSWSSRLRAYAVAWAMGLNELADPEPSPSEEVKLEDFDEPPDSYTSKFDKLVSSVVQEFARLARIPAQEQKQFSLKVAHNLACWIAHVEWENHDREFLDCLNRTMRSAAALYRDLERLLRHIEESENRDSYSMRLMPSVISRMLHYLPAIIEGVHRVMPTDPRGHGRPPGRKQYPGLAELVSELQLGAQDAGGGFGVPNKKLKKGRLIQALNSLRAFLAGSNDWSWLAEFLPTPGQHPFSVYESALIAAYRERISGFETLVENKTEAEVEKIDPVEIRRMRAMAQSMTYMVSGQPNLPEN